MANLDECLIPAAGVLPGRIRLLLDRIPLKMRTIWRPRIVPSMSIALLCCQLIPVDSKRQGCMPLDVAWVSNSNTFKPINEIGSGVLHRLSRYLMLVIRGVLTFSHTSYHSPNMVVKESVVIASRIHARYYCQPQKHPSHVFVLSW